MSTKAEHTQEARDLVKDLLAEGRFSKNEIRQLTGIDFSTISRWRKQGEWKVAPVQKGNRLHGTEEGEETVRRAKVIVQYIKDMKRAGRWQPGGNPRLPRTIEETGNKAPGHRVRARFSAIDLDRYRSLLDLMKRGFRLVPTDKGYAVRKGGAETAISARMANELMQSCLVHKIQRHGQPQYMVRRRTESPLERMQRGVDRAVEKMTRGGGDGEAESSFKGSGTSLPSIAEDKGPASRKQRDIKRSHARQSREG